MTAAGDRGTHFEPPRLTPPEFFERVRAEAQADWDDWESNPRRGAPVLQLFRQVKSPHHVLSELLQNADDAGASWVRAAIEGDTFVFEHDGADFEEEHFASLCRFGYSNKRHLHTIGFRGLGFKSVFSYGPTVELTTPHLTVAFEERRFTLPIWRSALPPSRRIRVSVRFADERIARRAADDLDRWSASPVPLLFFRSVRRMQLGESEIAVETLSEGPVPSSEWARLAGSAEERVLIVRSGLLRLPDDAVAEIQSERMDDTFVAGNVQLQLAFGLAADDQLYVVLPAKVLWGLPFSANAPFIQLPDRSGIKDPDNSPLNRWLLEQVGELAGRTMVEWLRREDLELRERADAYGLLPPAPSVAETVAAPAGHVIDGLTRALADHAILLGRDGELVPAGAALDLPSELLDVWPNEQALAVFGAEKYAILAGDIPASRRAALAQWRFIERLDRAKVCERLCLDALRVPRPALDRLEVLWDYVQPHVTSNYWQDWPKQLKIVPVRDGSDLRRPIDVLAVEQAASRFSSADWTFLSGILDLMDPDWLAIVRSAGRSETSDGGRSRRARAIFELAKRVELTTEVSVEAIIARASIIIVALGMEEDAGVRLAQIAASCNVRVSEAFPYRVADGSWHSATDGLLAVAQHHRALLPVALLETRTLHPDYEASIDAGARAAWRAWLQSDRSRLRPFSIPSERRTWISAWRVRDEAKERGGRGTFDLPYQRGDCYLEDYDYSPELWEHWEQLAGEDCGIWSDVLEAIATTLPLLESRKNATFGQQARVYSQDLEVVAAEWLRRFRALQCVRDDRRVMALPATLLRRTPATSDLEGIESFVDVTLDRSDLHPLFDLLGVRSSPSNANSLIERLRALTRAPNPPEDSLGKIYSALDRLVARLPADAMAGVRTVFERDPLIRGSDDTWHRTSEVFVDNPEHLPGVVTVWERAGVLSLWPRLGVAPRPTTDMLLEWLRNQAKGEKLASPVRKRVEALLATMPERVVQTCEAWLDLDGYWTSLNELRWYTRDFPDAGRLFAHIRHDIADVSMVPVGLSVEEILETLMPLDGAISWAETAGWSTTAVRPSWVGALANCMLRVKADSLSPAGSADDATHPDHATANRLAESEWDSVASLLLAPYLAGRPAGAPRSARAYWDDRRLVVVGASDEYLDDLVDSLSRPLRTARLRDAVAKCVEREPGFIERYFGRHFDLSDGPVFIPVNALGADVGEAELIEDEPAEDGQQVGLVTLGSATRPHRHQPPVEEQDTWLAVDDTAAPAQLAKPSFHHAAPAGAPPRAICPSMIAAAGKPARVREHWRSESARGELLLAALAAHGYVLDPPNDRLRHTDGGWAELAAGDLAHAITYGPEGLSRGFYWAGDADLSQGLEIPSEVWQFLEQRRSNAWIVLPGAETIQVLLMERFVTEVEVHPASFRLKLRISPAFGR